MYRKRYFEIFVTNDFLTSTSLEDSCLNRYFRIYYKENNVWLFIIVYQQFYTLQFLTLANPEPTVFRDNVKTNVNKHFPDSRN